VGHHVPLFLQHEPLVAPAVDLHRNRPRSLSARYKKIGKFRKTYHIKFINVVVVIIIIFVIVIVLIPILREHVVFERLAGEIVNTTWYDLQAGTEGETR
jgi:hypothetical protein